MAYIKKLVMHGFKSFARKTEIPFDKGINIILGPNGSGKSNVADALCFVLGRLSIKSMRAAKAKNLIFMGSKYIKPAHEASVELIFDNTDKSFSLDTEEVILRRAVRTNGQSIYKINGEAKTRAEVIEMLAQAGIDPHGFNLVLQGQIQSIVKMHPEERRKIIEEVAGISIYESRKEKSLHELEKTDEKLKEISTILRERTAFLRNLEKEKAQAEKFKELETTVKRAKASILHKRGDEKTREINSIVKSIEGKMELKNKVREKADKLGEHINEISEKINQINRHIQQSTGLEQDNLHNEIANLKAEIEGLKVRKESYEARKAEIERRISEINKTIPELEGEIRGLRKESPGMAKKAEELKKKKEELSIIEQERRKSLTLKSDLNSMRERIREKELALAKKNAESESIVEQLESYSSELSYKNAKECESEIEKLRKKSHGARERIEAISREELHHEKIISISEFEIERALKGKSGVEELDLCPLCQSKITEEHKKHVFSDSEEKIKNAKEKKEQSALALEMIKNEREEIRRALEKIESERNKGENEIQKHRLIESKKEQLKGIFDEIGVLKRDIGIFMSRRQGLETKGNEKDTIEEQYERKLAEIEEISSRTEEDVDTTLLYKEREIENMRNIIKRSKSDSGELKNNINEIESNLENKSSSLEEKEKEEKELSEKFKKLFEERDKKQREIQENNIKHSELQNEIRAVEDQINYLKIGKAKVDAEKEGIEIEMGEYRGLELIQGSVQVLEERIQKVQEILIQIGSINMRALEVYDEVKKEYDVIFEKVQTLEKEKIEIMKIVEEIDKKKTKSFMKTFKAMNELFSQNFSKLSAKGIAYLEIENKEEIFSAGVNIVVRLARGKYFDVTSLSGGEQTLVALSLLFAIQEYKPYHFYIFDEIDAALDKRNSERLSALLTQYMKSGQYIVVTHNDAIIMNSNVLYGVSMHDGVSKILSLKV